MNTFTKPNTNDFYNFYGINDNEIKFINESIKQS